MYAYNGERPPRNLPEPVVPNTVYPLKLCRFSESRRQWRHSSSRDRKLAPPGHLKIVTWNVDYASRLGDERMTAVLEHLQSDGVLGSLRDDILGGPRRGRDEDEDDDDDRSMTDGSEEEDEELRGAPALSCILFQEVNESALGVILQDEWVRRHFIVIPIRSDKWPVKAVYGNVTLVSKLLQVSNAKMLEYGISEMQRTALMVDIRMNHQGRNFTLRVINTHLESLPVGTPKRPKQMRLAVNFLKKREVDGGIIAGDMNPIDSEDDRLGESLGLVDAWWRGEFDEAGFTWGFQGGTENGRFPKARFDKILYLPSLSSGGRNRYTVREPKRIGMGVTAEPFEGRGQPVFASDHFGLLSEVVVRQ